jgi:hypothetical protein
MAKLDAGTLAELRRIVVRFRELRVEILETEGQIAALAEKSKRLTEDYARTQGEADRLFEVLREVHGPGALDPATLEWVEGAEQQ